MKVQLNSRKKSSDQILGMISGTEAQKLLEGWANINPSQLEDGALKRLVRKHPAVFLGIEPKVFDERFPPLRANTPEKLRARQKFVVKLTSLITTIATFLRGGWDASDPRRREWFFIRARLAYHVEMESLRDAVENMGEHQYVRETRGAVARPSTSAPSFKADPREEMHFAFLIGLLLLSEVPLTPFEAAMFHLQTQLTDKLRRCPNPTCPAPYFFATKKGQKFCSTVCAEPAQREAKRKWWNEHRGKKKRFS
jgi:hypothetical protein